jgi:hypothetical protein
MLLILIVAFSVSVLPALLAAPYDRSGNLWMQNSRPFILPIVTIILLLFLSKYTILSRRILPQTPLPACRMRKVVKRERRYYNVQCLTDSI